MEGGSRRPRGCPAWKPARWNGDCEPICGSLPPTGACMTDPFQNVSAAGAAFIATIAEGLEARAADPSMVPIIAAYLAAIDWGGVRHAIEIGSGTGPIARMILDRARSRIAPSFPWPERIRRREACMTSKGSEKMTELTIGVDIAKDHLDAACFTTAAKVGPERCRWPQGASALDRPRSERRADRLRTDRPLPRRPRAGLRRVAAGQGQPAAGAPLRRSLRHARQDRRGRRAHAGTDGGPARSATRPLGL